MNTRYQVLLSGGVRDLVAAVNVPPVQSSPHWQAYRAWLRDGNTPLPPDAPEPPPAPTPDEIQAAVVLATQARLDAFAKTRNYDGILSLASYATDPNPKFAAEGQCGVNARSSTWAALYAFLAQVLAGTQPLPTGFADVEPFLPALAWPDAP